MLVGFGQVICVPVGPRCDLCEVGKARLCPSYRKVDEKAALKRVKVELLDSDEERTDEWALVPSQEAIKPKVKVELEVTGPDGPGSVKTEATVKREEGALEW